MTSNVLTTPVTVTAFLQPLMPFNILPKDDLQTLAQVIELERFSKGQQLTRHDHPEGLRIIHSGAADLRNSQGQLLDRLGEGESFNLAGLAGEEPGIHAIFIEDTQVFFISSDHYQMLRNKHRPFDRFFHGQRSRRLNRALRDMTNPSAFSRPVTTLMNPGVFTVPPDISIQALARQMTEKNISSALITENDELTGIVTDRDLRSRVLAAGLSPESPVSDIMSKAPVGVPEIASHFDALLLMTRNNIHHLPVFRLPAGDAGNSKKITGMITTSDLMRAKQDDPLYLVQHIARQPSPETLAEAVEQRPQLVIQWVNAGLPANKITRLLSVICDAVTRRLIELAIEELGPAPVPFTWLAFGSQAREESLLNADQDNGLLISDACGEAHRPWFETLARFVCDGLNACGYQYCPGNIMATNPSWCQPLHHWKKHVDHWVASPTPEAVMRVGIFFDLRAVYGPETLCRQLQHHMLAQTRENTIFQAALAANVLATAPPLSFFRQFVVERNGEHKHQLDLKKRGVAPLVDMVRLHALANGIPDISTTSRLAALETNQCLTRTDSRNLADAFAFMMQVRVNQQATQLKLGGMPDNHCNPDELPALSRQQLRHAFALIHDSQASVKLRYRQGMGN